jgi:3-dehydroquinate dehydratase/shikimate dehydrogenase
LIAGYGGAARAAAVALYDAGANITVTGRNLDSAQKLARTVSGEAISLKQAEQQHFDALVHATPVGMSPKPNECIFRDKVPADVVLDMVYNPYETLLIKRAREQRRSVIHGIEMLLEQALSQFEIWTGETAPRAVMLTALEQSHG